MNCNVPILGHYNITTFQCVMPTRVARSSLFGPDLYRSSSGSIPHNWALVLLHSDDFRNFELLWVISELNSLKVIMGILLGETS
jgi:hypothetical protein